MLTHADNNVYKLLLSYYSLYHLFVMFLSNACFTFKVLLLAIIVCHYIRNKDLHALADTFLCSFTI